MKKLIVFALLGFAAVAAVPAKAQVSLSINIGSQPDWGPRGYNHVDYYYLPEVQSYYYVPTRQFIYLSGSRWIHARSLPSMYRGYDLYGGRKIVINGDRPYLRHDVYRTRYATNYVYNRPQRVVYRDYDKHEYKRYEKEQRRWEKQERHDRGHDNGRGWGRGRDRD
ncbi:hypothetical protein [Pedobacter nutrimenti]|jgi:hypothetical protein|uniref:YXWGXW repeat-containing protein n=1 Tax=Pedobacter nutrimenti TaxID=1241337 RepID=A0A318UIJ6_9SPHI|nr:hypothetical protein [Pedobacter nutrimenti]PYF72914.1 hypothetical protein B0O44_105288 [Pedobacter nutrimenti]|eukprot:gene14713-17390_t